MSSTAAGGGYSCIMARLKYYARALASGYLTLGANIAFTLASVPLALAYLPKQEFGLWALTTQLAGYMALIDVGMAGSSRILIDYKDQKNGGHYGSVIQTMLWVSAVQGLLILATAVALGVGLGGLIGVPPALQGSFLWLIIGQGALLAGVFLTRLFNFVLVAHHRYDLSNYIQGVALGANFAVMWGAFAKGQGVLSLLWGQWCGWMVTGLLSALACRRLGLFPTRGGWGKPSWARFRELFVYGWDIFLLFLGSQLVSASQAILVARVLGLEAAAAWAICTRVYLLLLQVVYRIFDFSCAALAEMIVRQEMELLLHRFKSIVVLSVSLGVVGAVLLGACNGAFVSFWTSGRIHWAPVNDLLLACWLTLCVISHSHIGLVGQAKEFRLLPYLYLLEGIFFVGGSLLVLRTGGITAMLVMSVVSTMLFSLPYSLWRTSRRFDFEFLTVAIRWMWPSLRLAASLVPAAVAVWFLTRTLSTGARLAVNGAVLGLLGGALLFRLGLGEGLETELLLRSPAWLKPWLTRLCGRGGPGAAFGAGKKTRRATPGA